MLERRGPLSTDLPIQSRPLVMADAQDREKLRQGIAAFARSCYHCHKDCGTAAAATACELAHEADQPPHAHPHNIAPPIG